MRYFVLPVSALALTLSVACSETAPSTPLSADPLASPGVAAAAGSSNARFAGVKQATAAFHDVGRAVAAGYLAPDAGACVASPAGGMGTHAVNPTLAGDQLIDPLRPEVLLYEPKHDGGFKLVGVEYFMAVLVRNTATGQVSPWFADTPWPAEYEVVTPRPSAFGQAFDGPMPGHEPGMPWHYDLHVWTWAPNPSGDFAMFNPRVSCAGSGGEHAGH